MQPDLDHLEAKADRLVNENRVNLEGYVYTVEGDHGSSGVTVEGTGWKARVKCDCPATGYCSHARAVYRMVTKPSDPFEGLA